MRISRNWFFVILASVFLVLPVQAADPIECFNYGSASTFTGQTTTPSPGKVMVGHGDWTWSCSSNHIITLDTSDPYWPQVVGQLAYSGEPQDCLLAGNLLVVAYAENKLGMFDVSTPNMPLFVRTVSLPSPPLDLAYRNGLLLVAAATGGLLIYDVSNPGVPPLLNQMPTSGEAKGVCFTTDSVALLASYGEILEIDLTNPQVPVVLGAYTPFSESGNEALYWDVEVADGHVVATITDSFPVKSVDLASDDSRDWDSTNSLLLFDGLVPSQENRIGYWLCSFYNWQTPVFLGAANGSWVILHYANLVYCFDTTKTLANPSSLAPEIIMNAGSAVTAVAFSEASISIASEDATIQSMLNSEPVTVTEVASFADGQYVQFPGGPWAYSYTPGNGYPSSYKYYLWDLRQPLAPMVVDSLLCNNHPDYGYRRSIKVARGDLLLEVESFYNSDEWYLRDWSTVPASSASIYPARDIAVFCGELLVTAGENVVDVFDIGNPAAPVQRGSLSLTGSPSKYLALEGCVLLACGPSQNQALYSIDLADPDYPAISSSLPLTTPIAELLEFGDLVLALDWDGYMRVIDPITLNIVGEFDSGDQIKTMAVSQGVAWVGWGDHELAAVDLSDPVNPTIIHPGIPVPDQIQEIAIAGDLAYIACGAPGLHVVNIHTPTALALLGGGSSAATSVFLIDVYPVISNAVLAPDCSIFSPVWDQGPLQTDASHLRAAPNPFNGHTVIQLKAHVPDGVQPVDIFDLKGQRIIRLSVQMVGGIGEADWFGTDGQGRVVSSGVYFTLAPALEAEVSGRLVYLK